MVITLGIIGYGEVGAIFCRGLLTHTNIKEIWVWDLKFADPVAGAAAQAAAVSDGMRVAVDLQALCAASDLIISAVTASSAWNVAENAAKYARAHTRYLDLNSASPKTKQQAGSALEAVGVSYTEAGVMTSVPPYGIRVPMLLGGPGAEELAIILRTLCMNVRVVSLTLGVASAIKMSRSIMIKGLEALVVESYTTARFFGVEEHVLPTLKETFPQIDWDLQGAYFFNRVAQHGKRRAEELREAARTVSETGFDPLMATAIASKQDWVAQQAQAGAFEGLDAKSPWQAYADRLIGQKRSSQ